MSDVIKWFSQLACFVKSWFGHPFSHYSLSQKKVYMKAHTVTIKQIRIFTSRISLSSHTFWREFFFFKIDLTEVNWSCRSRRNGDSLLRNPLSIWTLAIENNPRANFQNYFSFTQKASCIFEIFWQFYT